MIFLFYTNNIDKFQRHIIIKCIRCSVMRLVHYGRQPGTGILANQSCGDWLYCSPNDSIIYEVACWNR